MICRAKMYCNQIWKILRFVSYGANLTHFGVKSDSLVQTQGCHIHSVVTFTATDKCMVEYRNWLADWIVITFLTWIKNLRPNFHHLSRQDTKKDEILHSTLSRWGDSKLLDIVYLQITWNKIRQHYRASCIHLVSMKTFALF